jgi:hypothetical protein
LAPFSQTHLSSLWRKRKQGGLKAKLNMVFESLLASSYLDLLSWQFQRKKQYTFHKLEIIIFPRNSVAQYTLMTKLIVFHQITIAVSFFKIHFRPGVVAHGIIPVTQEAEIRRITVLVLSQQKSWPWWCISVGPAGWAA